MADWSREFDDPIPLPRGRQLITIKDAADYNETAEGRAEPRGMADRDRLPDRRRFMMHSRIGVLRALNRNVERTFTDRKEMH
jgi:hypothetical protein